MGIDESRDIVKNIDKSWDIVNDIDESLDIVNDKIWEIAIDERWEGWGQSH